MNSNPLKVLEKARKLCDSHQFEEACGTYQKYLACEPKNTAAWVELGNLLLGLGRVEEACSACKQALILDPQHMDACLTLAEGLVKKHDLSQAFVLLSDMIQRDPGSFRGHQLLRLVLFRQGDWSGLHSEFERHIDVHHSSQAAWEKACLNLQFGIMPLGWDQYESRWDTPGIEHRSKEHVLPQPQWEGELFSGKTLLLRWEQGFGDAIMFVRYAPMVKARGGRVLLEVLEPLVDLMATCPGVDQVVKDGDPIPPFDLQISLLSLPRIFQTAMNSIPADIPYLSDPRNVPHREGIDRILDATKGYTRVGLVWAGRPRSERFPVRSVSPAQLKPLAALPGVAWHSFQVEPGGEQPFPGIIPMGPVVRGSFSDTAHALLGMDLVITVDTALAHLAGALGIPTFLLAHTFADWRWLMGREDSPWYPTMRIYRQPEPGDWASVIERVVADLSSCG
jgi:Tfp pilus assembly protein PilF